MADPGVVANRNDVLTAKKWMNYGTAIVDLEHRQVMSLLAERSAVSSSEMAQGRREIEMVSRNRAGLYDDGVRQGAPQTRRIADRFHLLQISGKPPSGNWAGSETHSQIALFDYDAVMV